MPVVAYDQFVGGMNTALSASDIADSELVECLNMTLDRRRSLQTRLGVTSMSGTALSATARALFHFRSSGGEESILVCSGSNVYRKAPGSTSRTDITSTLTLPASGRWQWCVINDVAVGVNGATTTDGDDNPVKLTSPTGNALAALGGSPPKGKYVASWNHRLWIVDADEPNRLHFSALGDHEDWSTTGAAGFGSVLVGGNEGDDITGIYPHMGRLFIFKRQRIYVMNVGSPNTDARQWTVDLLTDRLGCVSGFTIQPVMNDLVFLSDSGVASLRGAEAEQTYEQTILSHKIPELTEVDKSTDRFASVVDLENSQYWISVPSKTGLSAPDVVYVMSYGNRASGIAWTRMDGGVVGSSYATVLESGRPRIYVGGDDAVYRYGDDGVWSDAGSSYNKRVKTKAYSPGPTLTRKEFYKFGLEFSAQTEDTTIQVTYSFDEDEFKTKTVTATFGQDTSGGIFDQDNFDEANFAADVQAVADLLSRFSGAAGRRGQTVQFELFNNLFEGFTFKRLTLDVDPLSQVRVSELDTTKGAL